MLINPSSADYTALEHFVDLLKGNKDPCDPVGEVASCDVVEPGPRQLRRLTRFEYDRTVSDVFNIDSYWGASFTPEVVVHSFDNNGAAVTVDSLFADQVRKAAEEIAEQQVSPVMGQLGCPQGGAACLDTLLDTVAFKLFRRPLTDKERGNYKGCLLYTSPSPRDQRGSRMPSSA